MTVALGEYAGEDALLATEASIHRLRTVGNTCPCWRSVCRNFKNEDTWYGALGHYDAEFDSILKLQ